MREDRVDYVILVFELLDSLDILFSKLPCHVEGEGVSAVEYRGSVGDCLCGMARLGMLEDDTKCR